MDNDMHIAMSHTIDDLSRELYKRKDASNDACALLEDAIDALKAGRLNVVAEFIDRALMYLINYDGLNNKEK